MFRRAAPLAFLALLSCQDYRFNPVGRCLIQPGQVQVPLSGVSTADILFVIDDSGSMAPIQQNLADNFQSFIQQLAATQASRVAVGQPALDFYIAVTTSGVLVNRGVPGVNCTSGTCSISNPTFPPAYSYACSPAGSVCGDIITRYYGSLSGCTPPVTAGDPFPAGAFMSVGSNPKVLAFTKGLDWPNWQTDATIQGLIGQFQGNIKVGDCGANQEMHLEGGRLAVQKALAGQQSLPPGTTWPHPDSKLVVVWVGNEDDCSTRRADQGGVVWSGAPGGDTCEGQAQLDPSASQLYPVTDYATFFIGLGRPLGAAFIRPGDSGCTSGPTGYGNGTRFKALAGALRGQGVQVVEASVCNASFGATLTQIADLVKPPAGLNLPTQPAADVVTQLRLVGSDGKTAYVCSAPSPPPSSGDWWFVDCASGNAMPAGVTSACILLNQGGPCVPSPGQTLVAEYLGRVPSGGCLVGAAGADSQECATALGGSASEWTCDGTTGLQGTCLCKTGP